MDTVVLFLVLAATAWTLVALAAPCRPRDRRRDDDRRLRLLERFPERVNTADLDRLLRVLEFPDEEIRMLLDKAADREISAFTMWMWTRRFDVHTLAVVLAADLTHEQLVRHLADGSLPDLGELRVFAALNGLTIAGGSAASHASGAPATPTASSLPPRRQGRQRAGATGETPAEPRTSGLPIIHEPGSWPGAA